MSSDAHERSYIGESMTRPDLGEEMDSVCSTILLVCQSIDNLRPRGFAAALIPASIISKRFHTRLLAQLLKRSTAKFAHSIIRSFAKALKMYVS